MNKGFIKLHRSIINWEWFDDANTFRLFLTLLLIVNYEDKKWRGITVKKGSIITSFDKMAERSGLTVRQTRTAIKHLESTGELTRQTTSQYQLVTLCNWEKYQDVPTKATSEVTTERHSNDIQTTTTKERKEIKEEYIPTREEFVEYCLSKKQDVDPVHAGLKYDAWVENGWKDGNGKPVKNWKSKLINTIPHLNTTKARRENPRAELMK